MLKFVAVLCLCVYQVSANCAQYGTQVSKARVDLNWGQVKKSLATAVNADVLSIFQNYGTDGGVYSNVDLNSQKDCLTFNLDYSSVDANGMTQDVNSEWFAYVNTDVPDQEMNVYVGINKCSYSRNDPTGAVPNPGDNLFDAHLRCLQALNTYTQINTVRLACAMKNYKNSNPLSGCETLVPSNFPSDWQ